MKFERWEEPDEEHFQFYSIIRGQPRCRRDGVEYGTVHTTLEVKPSDMALLVARLSSIAGVVACEMHSYRIELGKAKLFEWELIIREVQSILANYEGSQPTTEIFMCPNPTGVEAIPYQAFPVDPTN